jgi:hypothetical protein
MEEAARQSGGRRRGDKFALDNVDWATLLVVVAVLIGVLLAPYELLFLVHRLWERRRRERIARGEDVTPKKQPWDLDL